MKKLILVLSLIFYTGLCFPQTSYMSHRVQDGETVFSITQKYQISEADLFRLNPEVKKGLKENTVLIIPKVLETVSNPDNGEVSFKTHKVKRKETIFGIATAYGTSVEEIKKYNKHLYSSELRRGEKIKIPLKKVTIISPYNSAVTQSTSEELLPGKHKVASQETKFGIAKQYNISVAELEALNPSIYGSDDISVGTVLNVPKKSIDEKPLEEEDSNYTFYTVKPKEGFYRMKVLFGLTEEELKALNPHIIDGLKEGMVIKVPKATSGETPSEVVITPERIINLEYSLSNFETKNLVVFLPFELQKIQKDSLELNEEQLKNNSTMRLALDFYTGMLIATEFAKQKGISVKMHVFDSRETEGGVLSLFRSKNIQDVDLVIGPLRQTLVERTASELSSQNIPVISPLSNRQGKMYSNFIQSIPQDKILENRMLSYLTANSTGKKLILITDQPGSSKIQRIQNLFPGIVVIKPREGNFFRTEDIAKGINKETENWVLLESSNISVVSSAIGVLNSLSRSNSIQLFTTDKNDAFDFREVSNMHLANLDFTYPSWNKGFDFTKENDFINEYQTRYGSLPNRFATRGFDITYDALLRMASADNIFDANEAIDGETVYVENKFNYVRNAQGGYNNNAVYIVKYTKELLLVEVE
ncbi:LysM peptidoglycan-binding domain-containing protein [Planktosalinus lacus]|nr:LysM peptidoglycan-binding domain-containing protein [Planktosalinus lacus]